MSGVVLFLQRIYHSRLLMLASGMCMALFVSTEFGYAMQPPPPPLDMQRLATLVKEANVICVAEVDEVRETEGMVETVLHPEKLMKGSVAGETIAIKETFKKTPAKKFLVKSQKQGEPAKVIESGIAGPSTYRGEYKKGSRVVLLLEKIAGTDRYRPLGSGTYDKHLCEFLIEKDGIRTLYFQFAADVKKYAGSEREFVGLIQALSGN